MARYGLAPVAKAGVNTANTVMWELRAAATERARIIEVGIFVTTAPTTAPNFVLARTTALGTTPVNIAGVAEDSADAAATGGFAASWAGAPTFTTAGPFIRQATLPLTAGSGVIWTFPNGLVVPLGTGATSAIVVANTVATGATLGSFSMYVVWDE